jgi:phospholipase C
VGRKARKGFKLPQYPQGDFMIRENLRWMAALLLATNLAILTPGPTFAGPNKASNGNSVGGAETQTPIKHVVVIFQENISFDHYFGTYPDAANLSEEIQFKAKGNTPSVNGFTPGLSEHNLSTDGKGNFYQPVRLDRSQNYTCDQNHDYTPEQQAFDSGLMDKFPEFTATPCPAATFSDVSNLGAGIVMGYYDGNTVTGLWNYAQNFVLNDNSFDTNFGPSTPGAINVISGMTGNADPTVSATAIAEGDVVNNSVIGDADPAFDDCSGSEVAGFKVGAENIGTLLSARGISWGWFQGGFTPTTAAKPTAGGAPATPAVCATKTNRLDGTPEAAYSPHHNPFQYYPGTSNPHHLAPKNLNEVGHDGQANHQYDLSYFKKAALAHGLPAVSYLKANRANDGHPSNSSPLDEQFFLADTINFLQSLPDWDTTTVIIAWDDSDGWYDHVMSPILNQSASTADALTGPGACGAAGGAIAALQSRCGYGPRLPLLIISPYAKKNFVDHTLTDQSSVVRFIEDNWGLTQIGNGSFDEFAGTLFNAFDFKAQRSDKVILDTFTGQVIRQAE